MLQTKALQLAESGRDLYIVHVTCDKLCQGQKHFRKTDSTGQKSVSQVTCFYRFGGGTLTVLLFAHRCGLEIAQSGGDINAICVSLGTVY